MLWTKLQQVLQAIRAWRTTLSTKSMITDLQSEERAIANAMNENYRPLSPGYIHGRVRQSRFFFGVVGTAITTAKTIELCTIPKGALIMDGKLEIRIGGTTPDVTLQVAMKDFALTDTTNAVFERINPDGLVSAGFLSNYDLTDGGVGGYGTLFTEAGIAANAIYNFGAYPDLIANQNTLFRSTPMTREMILLANVADMGIGGVVAGYINYVMD